MDLQLGGKVVLVTGGATGIGLATALAFVNEGAKVVVSGRRVDVGEKAVASLREAGGEAEFIRADVSRTAEVEALVAQSVALWGRLDVLVNNAGFEGPSGVPTADYSEEAWDEVMGVNLKGAWLCMKYAIPHLLKQPGSSIVNVSSVAGVIGSRMGVAYHASKHGVLGLTRAAAVEYGDKGLRVNAVAPGPFETEITARLFPGDAMHAAVASTNPLKRWGKLEEAASTIVWLCSPGAGYVTGHTLAIDGGFLIQ